MDYAKAFRIIRAAIGSRQVDIARRMGISASHLSLLEGGKREATMAMIQRFAEATGTTVWLIHVLAAPADQVTDLSALRALLELGSAK